jgi:hypothetical protein
MRRAFMVWAIVLLGSACGESVTPDPSVEGNPTDGLEPTDIPHVSWNGTGVIDTQRQGRHGSRDPQQLGYRHTARWAERDQPGAGERCCFPGGLPMR